METIRGKTPLHIDFCALKDRLAEYNRIVLDLGTGDGRYVRALASRHVDWFVVGVDACRENLYTHSGVKLPNMLFVIASAQQLPPEFSGLFSHVTINFPWGSLLESLLAGDPGLMDGLISVSRPNAQIEIHLNGGALAQAGARLEEGAETMYENMTRCGWILQRPRPMDSRALKAFPTTWAKRLAYGRDPRAMALTGRLAY